MSQLRTHGERIKAAKAIIQSRNQKINIIEREAFVEFLLLEDIHKDYSERLLRAKRDYDAAADAFDKRTNQSNVRIFNAVVKVFRALISVTKALIEQGNYTAVWSAIPESKLAKMAKDPKRYGELAELSAIILKRLGNDAIAGEEVGKILDEAIEDFDSNKANARVVYDIPSSSDINAIVAETLTVAESILGSAKKTKPKIN
jgi:hypothetical protein